MAVKGPVGSTPGSVVGPLPSLPIRTTLLPSELYSRAAIRVPSGDQAVATKYPEAISRRPEPSTFTR